MEHPVPCNFRALRDWEHEAKRACSRIIHFEPLGLSPAIGPLFHVLIVLEK
jgi:hypothetical protein